VKGYRYELWCIARAAGIRYCVVYCDVDEAGCREWNKERSDRGEASYVDGVFEDLVRRFERPERRNRWDSPLFELYPSRDGIEKSPLVILEAVTYLTKAVDSKTQDVRVLQPSIATQSARFSEANSLYELDRATQEVINAVVEQQGLGGAISRVTLGNELPPIEICRPVGLPELRRLRRTFVKLMGQASLSGPPLPTDADNAKRRFVDYLERRVWRAITLENCGYSLGLSFCPAQVKCTLCDLHIKGYRYELWCIARAAGIRYCVVYCDVDEAGCREWNKERSDRGEASYEEGVFEDLVRRFERPKRRNRWDSPLFELYPSRDGIEKSSMRPVGLPELRRLRRTFVKLMGQASLSGPPLPTDADNAKRRFLEYLNREFGGQ
ncbi:hypothetical protein F2Q68_00040756, partial [Brassica cretica]